MSRKFALENPTRTARAILANCAVPIGADFHTLPSHKVDSLLAWADKQRYRKSKAANGSRARYFHDMLQRRAKGVTVSDARANLRGA
jgi:hypothetical protein